MRRGIPRSQSAHSPVPNLIPSSSAQPLSSPLTRLELPSPASNTPSPPLRQDGLRWAQLGVKVSNCGPERGATGAACGESNALVSSLCPARPSLCTGLHPLQCRFPTGWSPIVARRTRPSASAGLQLAERKLTGRRFRAETCLPVVPDPRAGMQLRQDAEVAAC